MAQNLIGLPPDAEVWRVDQSLWVVWYVPNTDPPVPIAWQVPTGDAAALGISGADRTLSSDDFARTGALNMGSTDEIPDPGTGVHPFDALVSQYATEVQVKPWLADPEVLAIWAGAAIEGRSVTPAELQTTEWWRTHSATERRWLSLNASDPATAQKLIADNRLQVSNLFQQLGVDNASEDLINFVADQWTTGVWSEAYAVSQIQSLADPSTRIALDPALEDFRQGLDTTRGREEEVRSLVNRWLGPAYAQGWTQDIISQWAGELRSNPDAETELIETLRNQRLALFPEYDNPNLTYEAIAAPWRGVWQQLWGEIPDESSSLFTQIVRTNDLAAAEALLRQEGVKRGNATVVNSLLSDIGAAFGGQVRKVGTR
ncbi:MAG: hypothetical protein ACE5F5_12475 [Acidimicrobiia bacterium]